MSESEIVAIIPIRFLPSTKQRLASILDARQRQELVKSMLLDVLNATNTSHLISKSIIVTYNDTLLPTVANPNFRIYKSTNEGLNDELMECLHHCTQQGSSYTIIILGDLPLLTGKVLDDLIWSGLRSNRPIIAKDWKGIGTNVLFFANARRFQFCFGERSLQKHVRELEAHELNPIIYYAMGTALDIDDDGAIEVFMKLATLDKTIQETNSYNLLKLVEKIKEVA
ncbi:MAG: 2-phospho-L-lactate guanylyltransferase [Promethearchaeota archaeon]